MRYKALFRDKDTYLFLLAVAALGYLFVANFPGAYHPIGTGLDASGRYALNYLSQTPTVLGRDVVFMYGPLAYLLTPLNIQTNIARAMAIRLLIHALLIGTLLYYLIRRRRPLPVILFVLGYWAACSIGLGFSEDNYEYSFLVAVPFLLSISEHEERRIFLIVDILVGSLAASFLFMKLTLGLPAFAMMAISLIVRLATKRQRARQAALVTAGAYLLTTIVIGFTFFTSPSNLFRWFRGSWDIADGFNLAMSVGLWPPEFITHALIALGIFLSLAVLLYTTKSRSLSIALGLLIAAFFVFKHGFVRQDEHTLLFYPFVLAAITIIILTSQSGLELASGTVCFLIVLALGIPVANRFNLLAGPRLEDKLLATQGRDNIRRLLQLNSVRQELDRRSKENLQAERLPAAWISLIKTGNHGLGTIPWESSYCAANDLPWDPFPTIQMSVAYTESLDRMAAEHYLGSNGPRHLLVDRMEDIDGRNLLLDAPATWRAIFQNYRVIERQSGNGIRLMEKISAEPEPNLVSTKHEQFIIGEWVTLPPTDNLLYSFISMRLRNAGLVSKIFFRIPPVTIDILYQSGKVKSHRLIPDTAKNGLLINYTANDLVELDNLLEHKASDKVVKIRVTGPGSYYYRQSGEITWKEDSSYTVSLIDQAAISTN